MNDKYRIVKHYGLASYNPPIGTVLERYRGHDYGLVRDSARSYGEECIALTTGLLSPEFIVVPLSTVEAV